MPERTETRSHVRARIVDVAARLLHDGGAAAVTTRGVADGAGVQAPTIYRLFGDKDGLLDAVAEYVMATFASAKASTARDASAEDVDPLDDLRAGWRTYLDFGLANPTLFALLSDPVRASRSPATRAGRVVLEARVHRLALAGRLRVGEGRAVDLIHAAGTGALLTLLATPAAERDTALADELFDAVLQRILTDPLTTAGGAGVAPAIALRAAAPGLGALSGAERVLLLEWLDRVVASER